MKNDSFYENLKIYNFHKKMIKYLDLITLFVDLVIILVFYFDHFDYINNEYELKNYNQNIRIVFTVISIILCINRLKKAT